MRDHEIRSALKLYLRSEHPGDDALILNELGLREHARADIALVNGSLNGFEIKSDVDSLSRLPRQRSAYGKFFDTVTIVVGSKHLQSIKRKVPRWWGIYEAVASAVGLAIRVHRHSKINPNVCGESVASLLWRSEALDLLQRNGLDKGLRSKSRDVLCKALADSLPLDELKQAVRDKLKGRKVWRSAGRQMSSDGLSRLVSRSLHSPVRQSHLHNHRCSDLPR